MGESCGRIKLSEYIEKKLIIPAYQRGYVWGKKDKNRSEDSVTYLLHDLIGAYNKKQEKFLQAITVYEEDSIDNKVKVNIVDGQQRTVFFYLLLSFLGDYKEKPFDLTYTIREESNEYLMSINQDNNYTAHEDFKDVYFFKKSIDIFSKSKKLNELDKKDFKKFLLDKVSFLYLTISKEHVKTTFTMMNGNKANMRCDELIKAEFLRLISFNENDVIVNRARVAKEWERWIQWWNRQDVKSIFIVREQEDKLKELISLFYLEKSEDEINRIIELSGKNLFLDFKSRFLLDKEMALKTFNELRHIQKKFEDIFNDPIIYNRVGFILQNYKGDNNQKYKILDYLINNNNYLPNKENSTNNDNKNIFSILDKIYYLSSFRESETTPIDITSIIYYLNGKNKKKDDAVRVYEVYKDYLDNSNYSADKEFLYSFLLLLNIEEDNKLNRKFNFGIINKRSLEHIYPQSKFVDEENTKENSITITNGNSIGNLVLLYGNENSELSNKNYEDKKEIFFKYGSQDRYRLGIHLLDTVREFSKIKWDSKDIEERKKGIICFFDDKFKQFNDFFIDGQ